jgi:hypothetical protein
VAVAIGAMAAISVAIYLGLVARGNHWPLYVLAVAAAPLALLAAAQGIQAVVSLGRGGAGNVEPRRDGGNAKGKMKNAE